jgi:hypothetical protein
MIRLKGGIPMQNNTIRLIRGSLEVPAGDWLRSVNPGDAVRGPLASSVAVEKVWPIEQEVDAREYIAHCHCDYDQEDGSSVVTVKECALEWGVTNHCGEYTPSNTYELGPTMDGYYQYFALASRALSYRATAADVEALANWFEWYGSEYWTGEYFRIDSNNRLYRVYEEIAEDEWEVVGYEIR